MVQRHIGRRIREVRKARQLSVRQLAGRVGVAVSTLEKYETGSRVPPAGTVLRIASALGVGPERLHGQPYDVLADVDPHGPVPELRRIMLTYDSPEDLDVPPRSLAVLGAEVDRVSALRRDARYSELGPLLAPLVTELTHAALDSGAPQAWGALARSYRAVNSFAHKLGHHDMSNTALERLHWAADRSCDPLMQITAGYLVAGAMVRQGALQGARRKLSGLIAELERQQPEGCYSTDALGVHGALLLKIAIVEARAGRVEAMRERLQEARTVAEMAGGGDRLVYETSFGPTNIRIHEVSALLEVGDTGQALALVGEWGRAEGRGMWMPPPGTVGERASHHWVDLAAVQLAEGDRAAAFGSLKEARRIAPAHTRYHPSVRATAATLVRLDQAQSDSLAGFARWVGM